MTSSRSPLAHDVGVVFIDVPGPIVGPYTEIVPRATVENFGTVIETFEVCCQIDGYTSVRPVDFLWPGESRSIAFDPWASTGPGERYTVRVCTLLEDDDPDNDCQERDIEVREAVSMPVEAFGDVVYDHVNRAFAGLTGGPATEALFIPRRIDFEVRAALNLWATPENRSGEIFVSPLGVEDTVPYTLEHALQIDFLVIPGLLPSMVAPTIAPALSRVEGEVYHGSGGPVVDEPVELFRASELDESKFPVVETDEHGLFAFDDVPAGEYRCRVLGHVAEVTVEPATTASIVIHLPIPQG